MVLVVALIALLAVLILQPDGSYGKAGPLTPAALIFVVAVAGATAAILRACQHPFWGLLLGGVAGGFAAGSLHGPQGSVIGLVAGAIVATAPSRHVNRPKSDDSPRATADQTGMRQQ